MIPWPMVSKYRCAAKNRNKLYHKLCNTWGSTIPTQHRVYVLEFLGYRALGSSASCCIGSEQALAPVRELLKRLYLCNKYAPADGGLLRTYMLQGFVSWFGHAIYLASA
jgi:hypothetical protein